MLGWPAVDSGGNACCGVIGYDEGVWAVSESCFPNNDIVVNLKLDISNISQCSLVFAGNRNSCGNAVRFPSGQWPAIQTYLQNGGRMWMQAEFFGCLADAANLASFLAAIGSSLSWGGTVDESGTLCDSATNTCTPGAANIAQGTTLKIARASRIDGGTSVWISDAGNVVVAVEQIGSGFFFLSGDSNITDGCAYNNCPFLQRLLNYADDDII
jgi:hypothetical protein